MNIDYTAKAAEARAKAAKSAQDAQDSFDRCDTDGFVSQWASDRMASLHRLEADIADNEGKWTFPALTDLDGTLVPAVMADTRYGPKFMVFATADDANTYGSQVVEWVDPFVRRASTLARKGYRLAYVWREARADLKGEHAVNVRAVALPADGVRFDPEWKVDRFADAE